MRIRGMAAIRVKSRYLVVLDRPDAVHLEHLLGAWMPEKAHSLACQSLFFKRNARVPIG